MSPYRILLTAAAGAALLAAQGNPRQQRPPGTSPSERTSSLSSQDRSFLEEVAQANQGEIEMGRLALQKASNSSVKTYAQRLIDDHTKNQEELESLAREKGVTLPTAGYGRTKAEPEESASERAEMQRLSRMSGAEFDRAFVMQAVQDHEKAINTFEEEMRSTNDADIRNYVSMTLPTLRAHLNQAEQLRRTVQGD